MPSGMTECNKCKKTIRGETGIRCSGVCEKIYHCDVKCSGLDQYSAGILETNKFIRFMCDDCVQYIHNVDLVLKEIQDGVNKNKQNLAEYKGEFDTALKQNENEIKQLLEAIEKQYEERFKKIDNAQKICEENVQVINKLCGNDDHFESKNKQMCNSIEEKNAKMCDEIKKAIKETSVKQPKMSYASYAKSGNNPTTVPDVKKQVPLIIKPKAKQGVDKTMEELNKKVNPVDLKITNVENRKSGTIIIQTENNEEREKVKEAIQKEMSEDYEIKVPSPIEMTIAITDMSFKYSETELIEKLKTQNPMIKDGEISIIRLYEFKRYNKPVYNAKLKIDNDSYKKVMSAQKINIGWERCRVFDGTEILQCFKCKGYNHKSSECKNEEICLKCHGNHKSAECKKDTIEKCINCVRINNKLNLGLEENHYTMNRECPVYQNKLNMKKRRIGLNV